MRQAIRTGLDVLLDDAVLLDVLRSRRVGLLAHGASVTSTFEHAVDALVAAGVNLRRLFGPEHGLRGEAQDMIAVETEVDPLSGIPVVSLYGHTFESLTPRERDLDGLDVVVIDLQDVGSRYYTYVYTAMLMAEACRVAGVEVWILDRPNPIGDATEGPPLRAGFESFVGMLPIPIRHGLTPAEVLRAAEHAGRGGPARIVACEHYRRSSYGDQTDAPWVLPSPNMPTVDTAVVYPGMCLLEGTNLSEGRGTTRPFEIFGAPWVDAPALRAELERIELGGVRWRLLGFEPTFQKWARQRCRGLQLHVVERATFRPVLTATAILWACRRLFGRDFAWREKAYEFVDQIPAIDLLYGSDDVRRAIDSGADFADVAALLATSDDDAGRIERARLPQYVG